MRLGIGTVSALGVFLLLFGCEPESYDHATHVREGNPLVAESTFVAAAARGDLDLVGKLLRLGMPVDARDVRGRTALMVSAAHGELTTLRLLADRGADVEARTGDGATPLILAAREAQMSAARHLLERGANPCTRDNRGRSALDYGQEIGDRDLVNLLRAHGAGTGDC